MSYAFLCAQVERLALGSQEISTLARVRERKFTELAAQICGNWSGKPRAWSMLLEIFTEIWKPGGPAPG